MVEFFISVWSSMDDYKLFLYPVACAFICALVCLFRSFFGRGVTV